MLNRLIRLTPVLVVMSATATTLNSAVIAQEVDPVEPFTPPTVTAAIDEVFNYQWSGLHDWDLPGQLNWIFGWYNFPDGSYPENIIARNMEFLNIVYKDILQQQAGNDPVLRTRDLASPYASSIGEEPCYYTLGPTGCPEPELTPQPTFIAPVPAPVPEPVPGLW